MHPRSLLTVLAPPLCASCGASAGRVEPLCARCRASLRPLGWVEGPPGVPVWAAVAYEGGARALVRTLKFRATAGVAATMAAQLAAAAPDELLDGAALVPVPLHPARRRRRGFNQAERLARELALRRGCAVADCLERGGSRGTQVGRGRAERLDGRHVVVRLRPRARPPGRALLIDDVVTTGSTVAACAAVLSAAGADVVGALAYARTLGR